MQARRNGCSSPCNPWVLTLRHGIGSSTGVGAENAGLTVREA